MPRRSARDTGRRPAAARPRRATAERSFPGVGFALRGSRCQCSRTYWNASEALPTLKAAGRMENEELAALRATLLAAQRQPLAVKVRQARLSALLADGDELLPYVLSRSCSDPRDRTLDRDELPQLRVLEGGADAPRVARLRRAVVHE